VTQTRLGAISALSVGVAFKAEHFDAILDTRPKLGFFEVHAENYMGAGGPPHRRLEAIRDLYPLSLHGVGLSIGSPGPLDRAHLARLARVAERYQPALVSEHLAWSTHDGAFFNDLLPLPYTDETLARVCEHIDIVQSGLRRTILLENPSTYVAFAETTIGETEFLSEIVRRTGCGLLLDVNNVFVCAANHGFDARGYLARFPSGAVGEIHLAGYADDRDDAGLPLLIDAHDSPVRQPVWALYSEAIRRVGPTPTLIEWDNDLPPWTVLMAEARRAEGAIAEALVMEEERVDVD
jgi:uncharacterized protein